MPIEIIKNNKYSELVNFKKNEKEPIHRWFKIKEGYSKELIFNLIDELNISNGYIVDFFNGSGTTTLSAKQKGLDYYGFEQNPFLYLLSKVKLSDYNKVDVQEITFLKEKILSEYSRVKGVNNINLSIFKNVFRENSTDMLKIKTMISEIKNDKIKEFFLIGATSILEDVGYAKKDGNGLKYPKNKKAVNFVQKFSEKIDLMLFDISNNDKKSSQLSNIVWSDSRNISKKYLKKIENNSSLVVFSPPYANCFDYTEVYKLELWFSGSVREYKDLKEIREASLSSHLNKDLNSYGEHDLLKSDLSNINSQKMWSKKIKGMINGYFYDMEKIIINAFNALRKGGYCVIIVGNSAYSGHIIETDVILSKIAEKIGFGNIKINIARKLRASSQQSKMFKDDNTLRESVIIMEKI